MLMQVSYKIHLTHIFNTSNLFHFLFIAGIEFILIKSYKPLKTVLFPKVIVAYILLSCLTKTGLGDLIMPKYLYKPSEIYLRLRHQLLCSFIVILGDFVSLR